MPIDVVATRDLVACRESQLPKMAVKYDVSKPMADIVRNHWTRRVTNRCVDCGAVLYKRKKCPKCHRSVESPLALLQDLPPKVVLIRTRCATCGRDMSFRAGHILKVTKQYGFFRPPKDCPRCKAKKLEAEQRAQKAHKPKALQPKPKIQAQPTDSKPKPQAKKTKPTKKRKVSTLKASKRKEEKKRSKQRNEKSRRSRAPVASRPTHRPEPWYRQFMKDETIQNRPFMVLEGLKIEK